MTGFHNLPRELHEIILVDVERADLLSIARAAKFTYALVVPGVYRAILISDYDRLLVLLDTIETRQQIGGLITHLRLRSGPLPADAVFKLADRLKNILPRLLNLVHLSISTALGSHSSVYDNLYLPSLREFHAFTFIDVQFFQRHTYLQEVTIEGLHSYNTGGQANLAEPHTLRITKGAPEQILRICGDGHARPTLHRIDWAHNPRPPVARSMAPTPPPAWPAFDYNSLHRVASYVTQVNYLNGSYYLSPALKPPWESVKRVGIRVTHLSQWPVNPTASIRSELISAASSFPNIETLDVIIQQSAWFKNTDRRVLTIWAQMQEGLLFLPGLRRVTLCGRSWTRLTPTSAFEETKLVAAIDVAAAVAWLTSSKYETPP